MRRRGQAIHRLFRAVIAANNSTLHRTVRHQFVQHILKRFTRRASGRQYVVRLCDGERFFWTFVEKTDCSSLHFRSHYHGIHMITSGKVPFSNYHFMIILTSRSGTNTTRRNGAVPHHRVPVLLSRTSAMASFSVMPRGAVILPRVVPFI